MSEKIPNLLTVKQFSKKHEAFPEGGLRYIIFHADKNGYGRCVKRVLSKVLIDESIFFECVEEQNLAG